MKDPAFVAEAAKLQLDVDPMTGEQVQALVAQLAHTPGEIATRVRAALEVPRRSDRPQFFRRLSNSARSERHRAGGA